MSYLSNANGQWQVVLSIPYITLKAKCHSLGRQAIITAPDSRFKKKING